MSSCLRIYNGFEINKCMRTLWQVDVLQNTKVIKIKWEWDQENIQIQCDFNFCVWKGGWVAAL